MINLSYSCDENLDNAPKTACGQFCTACQHDIYDFRGKSEENIRDIVKKDRSIKCGTFDSKMVKEEARTKVNLMFRLAFAAIFIFGLNSSILHAQESNAKIKKLELPIEYESNSIQISGTIKDEHDNVISNASVGYIYGEITVFIEADEKGNFVLDLPDHLYGKSIQVYFNAPGYEEKSISINNLEVKNYQVETTLEYDIQMKRGIIAMPIED